VLKKAANLSTEKQNTIWPGPYKCIVSMGREDKLLPKAVDCCMSADHHPIMHESAPAHVLSPSADRRRLYTVALSEPVVERMARDRQTNTMTSPSPFPPYVRDASLIITIHSGNTMLTDNIYKVVAVAAATSVACRCKTESNLCQDYWRRSVHFIGIRYTCDSFIQKLISRYSDTI